MVWCIVGAGSSSANVLASVLDLATHLPNLCGVIMDDFFERYTTEDGRKEATFTPEELADI